MLQCADKSFYVGSTSYNDVGTRVDEHNDGKFDGYTHSRRPVVLVWSEWCSDLRDAQVLERKIKGWRRAKKQALIERDWDKIEVLAKRPGARRPSRLPRHKAGVAPQGDALEPNRHPEVAAQRPSKDDGEVSP